jgi:hypothetical protein
MSVVGANLGMLLGLGSDAAGLTLVQISLRGVVVFVAALVIVRAAACPKCGAKVRITSEKYPMVFFKCDACNTVGGYSVSKGA